MSGPTIAAIQQHVAAHYGLQVNDLVSARTARDVTRARHIAMWLCRRFTPQPASVVGRQFGGRDHTTVLSAWRGLEARMEAAPDLKAEIGTLAAVIAAAERTLAAGDPALRDRALAMLDQVQAVEDELARLRTMAAAIVAEAEPDGQAPA